MADIVISEFMDEEVIRETLEQHDVLYDRTLVDDPVRLRACLGTARALVVRNRTQVDEALLEAAPGLEVVGRLGVGLDNIDLAACAARTISVRPATGANDTSVAEYVITAALLLLRPSWHANMQVAAGAWPRTALVGSEVSGKLLGLIGYGPIARATAKRAAALGMHVAAADPYLPADDPRWGQTQALSLQSILATADVISLHVPLTAETQHLIDAQALARMKREAVLINSARGGVVDENALVAALKSSHLSGAALDVFETEPLTAEEGARFAGIDNLLLTPHIAGVTRESNLRVSRATIANVLAALG